MTTSRQSRVTIAIAIAAIVVIAVVVLVAVVWSSLGSSEISGAGWVAMILGVLFTLGLGIGLMTLMFYSNRRGYD